MGLRINDTVPDFTAQTDQGLIRFHDWIGDTWAILFSHPKDFTPVCTTEFGAVAQLAEEWAKRNTKVIGISVDGVEEHKRWKRDIEKTADAVAAFPIIADTGLEVSKAFDMLPAEAYLPDNPTPNDSQTVRSVFIIGPDRKLKLSMTYPMNVGRNFAEVLRALDALQTTAANAVATPANWQVGEDIIIPATVSEDDAKGPAKDAAAVEHQAFVRAVSAADKRHAPLVYVASDWYVALRDVHLSLPQSELPGDLSSEARALLATFAEPPTVAAAGGDRAAPTKQK